MHMLREAPSTYPVSFWQVATTAATELAKPHHPGVKHGAQDPGSVFAPEVRIQGLGTGINRMRLLF